MPGCVDQRDFQSVHIYLCIGCVPGRTGDGTDNGAFLADQLVQQTGFARVRLADNRDLDAVILLFLLLLGEGCHQRVEQVAGPCPVHRGNGKRFTQAQFVELRRFVPPVLCLRFIHDNKDRRPERPVLQFLLRAAQDVRHFKVGRGHSRLAIIDEEDSIRFVDGNLGLLADLVDEIGGADRQWGFSAVGGIDAAGIDHMEGAPVPFGFPE